MKAVEFQRVDDERGHGIDDEADVCHDVFLKIKEVFHDDERQMSVFLLANRM